MVKLPTKLHYDTTAPRFKNWETPPAFFKKLDEEFHFTLDAAASHENALCDVYYTTNGRWRKGDGWPQVIVGAGDGQCRDGLTGTWEGERVFCNPPYDASIYQWVEKAFKFEAEVAVLLLPPSFDTAWGQKIWERARADLIMWSVGDGVWPEQSVEIRLPPGRLRFNRPAFANGFNNLGMYSEINPLDGLPYGERIFDYSKPHVAGEAPRAGNLIAIFRR